MRLPQNSTKIKNLERPVLVCAALLLFVSTSALIPTDHLITDLLSHFRFQYHSAAISGVLICLLLIFMGSHAKWANIMFLSAAIMNGWVLLPYVPTGGAQPKPIGTFKVAVAKFLGENHEHNAVLSFVRNENPDVLVLIKTNDRWCRAMAPLKSTYSYLMGLQQTRNFGLIIFSRIPIKNVETRYFA